MDTVLMTTFMDVFCITAFHMIMDAVILEGAFFSADIIITFS